MKNKKGFAISGVLYTLLLVFLIVLISGLNSLRGKKQILDQIKTETVDAIDQPWEIELANLQNQINHLVTENNYLKDEISSLNNQITTLNGSFKKRKFETFKGVDIYDLSKYFVGSTKDATSSIVVLGEVNNLDATIQADKRGFVGTIYLNRGGSSEYNITDLYIVAITKAYQTFIGKIMSSSLSEKGADKYQAVKFTYKGKNYIGFQEPATSTNQIILDGIMYGDFIPFVIPVTDVTNLATIS